MIKLVVTDMDGTLLDDNKALGPRFFEMEQALARKGIIFSVASGRPYYTLAQQFSAIAGRMLFVAENGAIAIYKDEVLFADTLDRASVRKLIATGRKVRSAYPILCAKDRAYIENNDARFLTEARHYYKNLEIVNDLEKVDDEFLKFTLCDFADAEKNSHAHFRQFEHEYKIAVAGKLWLDIIDRGANKGVALGKIQDRLGISPDETLVFGDYLNDLEMMRAAKYSYAMKNAHPEIIKTASFVTEYDNNNNGVIDIIYKLCLA